MDEQVQITLRSGGIVTASYIKMGQNHVLAVTKEVKDDKLFITTVPYDLNNVEKITHVQEAERRAMPQLLTEEDEKTES